jgi:hypothetical protein
VGNGGLSFRSVGAMQVISQEGHESGRRLFLNDTQPLPEDVFFANRVANIPGLRICKREQSLLFSVEQVICAESLGVHRFWVYHDVMAVCNHLEPLL